VAEEWREHLGRYFGELHNASNDDFRQRIDVPRGRHHTAGTVTSSAATLTVNAFQ